MALQMLLPLTVIVTLLSHAVGQRTFMRHCDCEYTVDGKCAYTLLLPTGGQEDSFEKSCSANNQIASISANVTNLKGMVTENTMHLSRLQNVVMGVQHEMLTNSSSKREIEAKLEHHTKTIDAIRTDLDSLYFNVGHVLTNISRGDQSPAGSSTSLDGIKEQQETARQQLNAVKDKMDDLKSEISRLQIASGGCSRKGVLMSRKGHEKEIEAFSVSSQYDESHGPDKLRIYEEGLPGAWCPYEPNDDYEWVQFDLGLERPILGVVTRGRADYGQWVTSFKVQYKNNMDEEQPWNTVKDVLGFDMTFEGNVDQNTPKTNMFFESVTARYVRIWPKTGFRNICLRADLIGCLDL